MIAEATQIELELKDLAQISAVLESNDREATQIELGLKGLAHINAVLQSNEVAVAT